MNEQDTVRLLRECDAGAKMGVESLNDVMGRVRSDGLRGLLTQAKEEHETLAGDILEHLNRFEDQGKDPPVMASAMSVSSRRTSGSCWRERIICHTSLSFRSVTSVSVTAPEADRVPKNSSMKASRCSTVMEVSTSFMALS